MVFMAQVIVLFQFAQSRRGKIEQISPIPLTNKADGRLAGQLFN